MALMFLTVLQFLLRMLAVGVGGSARKAEKDILLLLSQSNRLNYRREMDLPE